MTNHGGRPARHTTALTVMSVGAILGQSQSPHEPIETLAKGVGAKNATGVGAYRRIATLQHVAEDVGLPCDRPLDLREHLLAAWEQKPGNRRSTNAKKLIRKRVRTGRAPGFAFKEKVSYVDSVNEETGPGLVISCFKPCLLHKRATIMFSRARQQR